MRRFELIDQKSRKFWEIDVQQAGLTVRFGRLGTAGTTRTKTCSSEAAAAAEASRLIRGKTAKGYIEIAAAAGAGLSAIELDAIAGLLELAAPEYDGHSSNDYDVPSDEDNRSLIAATIDYGNRVLAGNDQQRFGDLLERDGRIFIWDSWLMYYLAHRCRAVLAALETPRGLGGAESRVLATLLEHLARDDCNFFEREPGGEDFSLAATEEHRALLVAATRHAAGPDLEAKLRALESAAGLVSAYAVDVLRWLALRCRDSAGHPPRLAPASAPAPESAASKAADAPTAVDRPGILKSWISEKTLLKRATEMDDSWLPAYAKNDADLDTYANGGNPFREYDKPTVPCRPPFADHVCNTLLSYERFKRERNVVVTLFGNRSDSEWQHEYERLAAYEFWQLSAAIQADGHVAFDRCVAVLAECVYRGHWRQAKYLALLLHESFGRGNVRMDDPLTLYQWWVRICFEFFDLPFDPARWRAYSQREDLYARGDCFGEPVLTELVGHWRDPDLSPRSQELIWLCDYYTQRTRYTELPEPATEFGNGGIAARLPIVILAWFRFRESLGLSNPDIRHPLMTARYARLDMPRPFFREDVLERVLARLKREELPTLGDLDDPTIPEPKRWVIFPYQPESKPYESVPLARHGAPGYSLWIDLPPGWVERSTPELLKFLDIATGTECSFSAYRNPGISIMDWAEVALATVARRAPKALRVAERMRVPSWNWTGMAEEFLGSADGGADPRHAVVVAGKSFSTLLVMHLAAKPPVFSEQGAFYRWLMEWKIGMGTPEATAVVAERHQDIPGFERIAPDPRWVDAQQQFETGLRHYHGTGSSEAEQLASRDRTLAAAWFERAAAQDHGKAQFNLAMILKNGEGVPQDVPAALRWARKARLQGVERAPQLIRELEALARNAKPFWKIW